MGDVGALALGGALGTIAVLVRQEFVLVITGGVFVMETLSVILQGGSYKLRGQRIFLMAPIHHHYELKGWPEPREIVRFDHLYRFSIDWLSDTQSSLSGLRMSILMDRWQGIQHVVVVGLGITGLSVVNYLRKYHPSVTVQVIDTREAPPGQEQLSSDVALHRGGWNLEWLLNADLVVTNPGIAFSTPEKQQVLAAGILVSVILSSLHGMWIHLLLRSLARTAKAPSRI